MSLDSEVNGTRQSSSREGVSKTTSIPLVVLSSRFKHANSLRSIANPGVAMVYYKYETTSLEALLDRIDKELDGVKAMSMALLMYGQAGYLKINKQKSVNVQKLREDEELRDFLVKLTERYLDQESPLSRVDLLQTSLVQNDDGVKALRELRSLMKVPVYASVDILGGYVSDPTSVSSFRIGTLYFDREKLNDWRMQTDKEARALYEKMWVEGTGAHGRAIVYRKKDDNSFVILKEINMMDLTREQRVRAMTEVDILARLNHPNIISYYDSFEEDGSLMIEMEYAEKGTLAKYLSNLDRSMSEKEMLTMFVQMVDAIDYLHKEKILHRDLKTANIFLTKEGMVKLGDFGISKILSSTHQHAQTVVGTPYYISPEICENRPYNTKSDIWSLGCILYEMACGKKTFEGTNLGALVHKIMLGTFDPISTQYSKGFRELVTDMLQVDPQDRPSAENLLVNRLPPLMVQFMEEMSDFIPVEDGDDKEIANTRSFLYHLHHARRTLTPVSIGIKARLEQVSIGFGHIVACTLNHTVLSWGDNAHGQLGHADTTPRTTPTIIDALKNKKISKIECGGEFSVFVSDNGIILTCGRGDIGALGHDTTDDLTTPKLIKFFISKHITNVACGESHVVAMTTDGLFSWGAGGSGRLGNGTEDNQHTPQPIPLGEPIESVKCGFDGTMFLTTSGTLLACGSNQFNKLGLNDRVSLRMQLKKLLGNVVTEVSHKLLPTPIKELKKHRVVNMALGPTHSAVLVNSGCVYTFGRNTEGQLGNGNIATSSVATVLQKKAFMILCSELSTVAVLENRNDINRSFVLWGSPGLIPTPVTSLLDNDIPKKNSSDGCYNGTHDNKGLASLVAQKLSEQKTRKLLAGVNDPPPGLSRIVPSSIPTDQSKDTAPGQSEDDVAISSSESTSSRNYLRDLLARLPSDIKDPKEKERGRKHKKPSTSVVLPENGSDVDSWQQMIGFSTSDGGPCDFSQLGWRNIRLSQLVSFGPNLLVLLEADVPESPEPSTLGGLKGASFRVNPELRPVPRWASSYLNIGRSRASTPQPKTYNRADVIVSMNDYLEGTSSGDTMMRTWLKDVIADARGDNQDVVISNGKTHDNPVLPLGLPAIVPHPPVIGPHPHPSASKHKKGNLSPRSPRKRSVSNEMVQLSAKSLSVSVSSSTLSRNTSQPHNPLTVRRHLSDNSLTTSQKKKDRSLPKSHGVGTPKLFLKPLSTKAPNGPGQGRTTKKSLVEKQPLSDGKTCLSSERTPHSDSRSESPPGEAVQSGPRGGLKMPVIVPTTSGDLPLLRPKRSNSGSQVLSPTFINRVKERRRSSSSRTSSLLHQLSGSLSPGYPVSDSTTTDEDVVIVTSRSSSRLKHSATTTTSEDSAPEQVNSETESVPAPQPLPSSSSDDVFIDLAVNKVKSKVPSKPGSARSHPPNSSKRNTPTKRSPYLTRISRQSKSRDSSAKSTKSHSSSAKVNKSRDERVLDDLQLGYEQKLQDIKKVTEDEKVDLEARINLLQCEKKLAEDKLREEQERLARDLEERRQLEQKISEERNELRLELEALKEEVHEYKVVVSNLWKAGKGDDQEASSESRQTVNSGTGGNSKETTVSKFVKNKHKKNLKNGSGNVKPTPSYHDKPQSKFCSIM